MVLAKRSLLFMRLGEARKLLTLDQGAKNIHLRSTKSILVILNLLEIFLSLSLKVPRFSCLPLRDEKCLIDAIT